MSLDLVDLRGHRYLVSCRIGKYPNLARHRDLNSTVGVCTNIQTRAIFDDDRTRLGPFLQLLEDSSGRIHIQLTLFVKRHDAFSVTRCGELLPVKCESGNLNGFLPINSQDALLHCNSDTLFPQRVLRVQRQVAFLHRKASHRSFKSVLFVHHQVALSDGLSAVYGGKSRCGCQNQRGAPLDLQAASIGHRRFQLQGAFAMKGQISSHPFDPIPLDGQGGVLCDVKGHLGGVRNNEMSSASCIDNRLAFRDEDIFDRQSVGTFLEGQRDTAHQPQLGQIARVRYSIVFYRRIL